MKRRDLEARAAELATEKLALQDRLDDLLTGFRFWREQKTASLAWDVWDEMLDRWVSAGDERA